MIIKDTESIDTRTSTGLMRTYLFRPATEGRYPDLLLYSEIFQVTGPIRRAEWIKRFIQSWPSSIGLKPCNPRKSLLHFIGN